MLQPRPETTRIHLCFMLLGLGLATLSPLTAQKFTSVTFESQDLVEKATLSGQMHFRDDKLRIDGAAGSQSGDYSMIFRGDPDLLWFLMHDQRQYIEMDRQTMAQMSQQISAMLAEFEEQLKSRPEEERESLRAMMKGRLPELNAGGTSPPEIRITEEEEEISGYPCVRNDVYQEGEKMAEVWTTSRSRVPGAEDLSDVFQKLADFYRNLTQGFAQFQTGLNFNILASLDGFPIRVLNYQDGQLRNRMLIQEVSQGSSSADPFEVPPDYKEEKIGLPR